MIQSTLPAVGARSLNHWTRREVPLAASRADWGHPGFQPGQVSGRVPTMQRGSEKSVAASAAGRVLENVDMWGSPLETSGSIRETCSGQNPVTEVLQGL